MIKKIFLLFFFVHTQLQGQTLSIGDYNIGSAPIALNLSDFRFHKKDPRTQLKFIENSLFWNRSEKNLVTPMIMVQISISQPKKPIQIKFAEQVIIPVYKDGFSISSVYVNLFSTTPIEIFEGADKIDEILIYSVSISSSRNQKIWIDHTCLPYQVQFSGVDTEYVSIGCHIDRIGQFGQEKPRLEVTLDLTNITSNIQSTEHKNKPTTFYFEESSEIKTELFHTTDKKQIPITMKAALPEKISRIRLAMGLGPYSFTAADKNNSLGPKTSFSYMLYGKFSLTETTSLKAFDALIYDSTLFNNSGLHFKYDENSLTEFEVIFPQGAEITYQHPFGQINSYLNYGMFLSTTNEPYKNIWLRYGQKIFYEINYITWGKVLSKTEMWGLSVGFPIAQFL